MGDFYLYSFLVHWSCFDPFVFGDGRWKGAQMRYPGNLSMRGIFLDIWSVLSGIRSRENHILEYIIWRYFRFRGKQFFFHRTTQPHCIADIWLFLISIFINKFA